MQPKLSPLTGKNLIATCPSDSHGKSPTRQSTGRCAIKPRSAGDFYVRRGKAAQDQRAKRLLLRPARMPQCFHWPSGLSLRQVPAGRIARSCVHPHRPRPILLRQAGKALRFRPCGNQVLSGNLAPNNSFKPSPLRGLVAVSLAGRGPA